MRKHKVTDENKAWWLFIVICAVIGSYFTYAVSGIGLSAVLGLIALIFAAVYVSPEGYIIIYGKDLSKPE